MFRRLPLSLRIPHPLSLWALRSLFGHKRGLFHYLHHLKWTNFYSFVNTLHFSIISKEFYWYYTGCPRKKSLIKFFLDDFPTDVDYGPTANFVAGHLVACQRSACYFFEGMTRSSRMLHSSAESWSVVHVRWEVVEEKFYQRLFSGTPCT